MLKERQMFPDHRMCFCSGHHCALSCDAELTKFDYNDAQFMKQIFLVDSCYLAKYAKEGDEQAFAEFRTHCIGMGLIHRQELVPGVATLYPVSPEAFLCMLLAI